MIQPSFRPTAGQYGAREKVIDIAKAAGANILKRAPLAIPASLAKEQRATIAVCLYDEDHCTPSPGYSFSSKCPYLPYAQQIHKCRWHIRMLMPQF